MKIIKTCAEMRSHSLSVRETGASVALVPTMGALHDGHLSLVKIAREHCGHVVMSIFVNPTQFGPQEDYDKYPRQFENDCELAKSAGCDCVFAPTVDDLYPDNYNTYVTVENITANLCGAKRPIHFRGVATVVLKLFNIVMPNAAIFGMKDAQQVIVIKRMVEDLNVPVKIISAPTVREHDGLAMSSRNAYLSTDERADAALIYQSLRAAKKLYDDGERGARPIKNRVMSILDNSRLIKTEYIEIVDTLTVKPIDKINTAALLAIACRMTESDTRLIDNIILTDDARYE